MSAATAAAVAFVARNWKAGLAVAVAGLALYGAYDYGRREVQAKWDLAASQQKAAVAEKKADQAKATVEVVTEYVDRVRVVERRGRDIIKEVPVYVTREDDARCGAIGDGFVRLWNLSNAEPAVPGGAGAADAGAGEAVGHPPQGEAAPE